MNAMASRSPRVTSGEATDELGTGDSAHYPADVPHSIENAGEQEAVVYLVVTYQND